MLLKATIALAGETVTAVAVWATVTATLLVVVEPPASAIVT